MAWAAWLLGPLAAAAPAPSSPDAARLEMQGAERNRAASEADRRRAAEQARAAQAGEARLAAERVSAAASLRDAEIATGDSAARIDALARRRAAAERLLAARADDLQPLLPLLERLSLYPAETLLAVPTDADSALTGVLVLHGLGSQLEQEAAAYRRQQVELDQLARDLAAEASTLQAAEAAQQAKAADLDRQLEQARTSRQDYQDEAAQATARAAAQAARAETLRGVIAAIDRERQQSEARAAADAAAATRHRRDTEAAAARDRQEALARPAGPGLGEARGQITAPVAGGIVRAWGATTDAGPATGVSYRAPPSARVVSPCDGRVVFSGPFRSYGKLMIVDCGGGYHFVLAGLDRLDVSSGRAVQAGEPIGVMPAWDPQVAAERPTLYVELRRNGAPVDPEPFLRGHG